MHFYWSIMNKNIFLFLLAGSFSVVSNPLYASRSLYSSIKDFIVTPEYISRYSLYDAVIDQNIESIDQELIMQLQDDDEYYLDMVEEYILKREANGPKADKSFSPIKITYGLCQLLAPVLIYTGGQYYNYTFPDEFRIPAIVVASITELCGIYTLYKGIFYKNRMRKKLERDKQIRRFLREITYQI